MMKPCVVLAAALLLAGCHYSETASEKITSDGAVTHISKSVDANGVKSTSKLELTRFAMRTPANGQTMAAAYFTVKNTGNAADRLQSVSCTCAAGAMFHVTTHKNGMVEMDEAPDGFPLPAGQTLVFAPGGNHIMLTGVTGAPKEGDTVDIVLTFAKAGPVTLHVPVRDTVTADNPSGSGTMSGMKM